MLIAVFHVRKTMLNAKGTLIAIYRTISLGENSNETFPVIIGVRSGIFMLDKHSDN